MNPVTVEMLREDWVDHPNLTDEQRAALEATPEATLQEALDSAFHVYEDMWWTILDNARADATRILLGDA